MKKGGRSAEVRRRIIHIDMDCFYAAIECRDDPAVADKPVAVAHDSARGVLTTCNYLARRFGCHSAMPVFKARELCPHLVIKPIRFDLYRRESRRIRKIFREFTDLIEPLSLDEAYLDVSANPRTAWEIAREIRRRIRETMGLTASAGVATNKMLAKIASDWNKPDGQFAVLPEQVEFFMSGLPVRKIPGIGPKAEARLATVGVETCGQLQDWDLPQLQGFFGPSWALELYERCRGRDERPVETDRPRKSLSVERTYESNLQTLEACAAALADVLAELEADWERSEGRRPFRGIWVKLKFANFQTTTCSAVAQQLDASAFQALLATAFGRSPHAVRLIGAGVRFPVIADEDPAQLQLFPSG